MAKTLDTKVTGLREAAIHAATRVAVPPSLRAGSDTGWLGQVQRAQERMPAWFTLVADHHMFFGLDRETDNQEPGWRITTREELNFQGTSMRDVFRAFANHYGLEDSR